MKQDRKLRIAFATEYLPPHVSGIANRCKNLINGFREQGHTVTVFSISGSNCDVVVPSVPNPFYLQQRMFVCPPWQLIWQLLDFTKQVPYDILHIVAPLIPAFIWVLPLAWLRGLKVYMSYHVFLEFYVHKYFGNVDVIVPLLRVIFSILFYIPLSFWCDVVGIPSKTADLYVFQYSKRIHHLKSGLDTSVFIPQRISEDQDTPLAFDVVPEDHTSEGLIVTGASVADSAIPDLRAFAFPTKKSGPLLIYVGRLAVEKNVEFLIKALGQPSLSKACLVIMGDGPCRQSLESLACTIVGADRVFSLDRDEFGSPIPFSVPTISQRVVFTGMILNERQVAKYFGQADIFVSASASETFGFTVAESMSTGTPAVVVRSGAFKSVYKMIDDWMFEENSEIEFADAITRVMARGISARTYARSVAVNGFSMRAAVLDLLATYQWIVDGCPSKPQSD